MNDRSENNPAASSHGPPWECIPFRSAEQTTRDELGASSTLRVTHSVTNDCFGSSMRAEHLVIANLGLVSDRNVQPPLNVRFNTGFFCQ